MVTLYNILFTIYCKKDIEKNLQKTQYIFTMMCRPMPRSNWQFNNKLYNFCSFGQVKDPQVDFRAFLPIL